MASRLLPILQRPDAPGDARSPTTAALHVVAGAQRAAAAAPELWAGLQLPELTAAQLALLAEHAQGFTPRVSLEPPDGLLLEVRGSLQLFGGVAGLRAALAAAFPQAKVSAFAPTPLAALIGARAGKPFEITELAQLIGQIAPLPLTLLRWPQETLARLKLVGVRTVGAALRLPRAGFARRFGTAQLAALDKLSGRAPDMRLAFHPRLRFRRRREHDCELTDHELLRAALTPLFADLDAFLTVRQCAVTELECCFVHRHAPPTCCLLQLAAPCAQAQLLEALLAEHLQALVLPEPVRACELRTQSLVPQQPGSACLWQPGEQGGSLARETTALIERLRARLGSEAVHGLTLLDGHRPESSWSVGPPPAMASPKTGRAAGGPAAARRRPLWLLGAPQPLVVRDGRPLRRGPLRLTSEPESIETGWWDGGEIARDYYTAVDIHGVRLWVFRERTAPHGWFLHGVFG